MPRPPPPEWSPQGVAEVAVSKRKDGGGIELALPFAAKPSLERVTIDRKLQLDLSGRREFTLDVEPGDMAAVGEITLYFKSGDGWYGCGAWLRRAGPQTLRFAKTSFRSEEHPGRMGTRRRHPHRRVAGNGRKQFASPQPPGSLGGAGEDCRAGGGDQGH